MKILVVSTAIPFPPIGGGLLRTYHLLRALASEHDVTLIGFTFDDDGHHETMTPSFAVRTLQIPWQLPPLYGQMQDEVESVAIRAAQKLEEEIDEPWFASFYESSAMDRQLRTLAREGFDLVVFEGTDAARFLPLFPETTPKVLDFMDVYSQIAIRAAERRSAPDSKRRQREAARTLRFESQLAQRCQLCLTCSDLDAEAARCLLDINRLCVVPNGVDTSFFTPTPAAAEMDGEIVFTGSMNYAPNVEAVQYFTAKILPLVQATRPSVRFHVVGAKPTEEVLVLASDRVVVHGRVPDIRPYLSMATVVVAPILSGGGTRLKILEAAAAGKAIVATSLGAEGLEFRSGEEILIADTPRNFADAIVRLMENNALRRQMGAHARQVSLRYDWDNIGVTLRNAVRMLA